MKSIKNLSHIVTAFDKSEIILKPVSAESIHSIPQLHGTLKAFYRKVADQSLLEKRVKVKYRLPEKLENMLMENAIKQGIFSGFRNNYDRARYRCMRNAFISQLLCMKGLREQARPLMMYALRTAKKYQLTATALELSRLLRYDAALSGNKYLFRSASKAEHHLATLLNAEMRAEELSHSMVLSLHHKYSHDSRLRKQIHEAYKEVNQLARRFPSHSVIVYQYRISVRYHTMMKQPLGVLKATAHFQRYLVRHPFQMQQSRMAESAMYAMDACLELRNLHFANTQAKLYGQYVRPSTINWFVFQELWIQMAFHARDYLQAQQIYQHTTYSENFRKLEEQRLEKWKLFNVYLNLALFHTGELRQIQQQRLLNNLPSYTNDKRGLNFPILIAELICLLSQEYSDRLVDFEERFHNYVKRYVSRKKHYRTWYFAKLILLLFKYDFDRKKCLQAGLKFQRRLNDFNERKTRDSEMIEIVPYEHLWHHITALLKQSAVLRKTA